MEQAEFTIWEDFEALKRRCAQQEDMACRLSEVVMMRAGEYKMFDRTLPYGALFGDMPGRDS